MSLLAMAGDAFSGDALNEADRQRAARPLSVLFLATRFNVREIIVNIFHVTSTTLLLVFPLRPLSDVRTEALPFTLPLSLSLWKIYWNLLKLWRCEGCVCLNACNLIERHCHWYNISTYSSRVYSWITYDEAKDAFGHRNKLKENFLF